MAAKQRLQFGGMVVLNLALLMAALPGRLQAQAGPNDAQVQADVQKALDNKQYRNVQATVQNGSVTLQGSVDVYAAKAEAEKRVHRVKKVIGIDNRIEVVGPRVEDAVLGNKLAQRLATDRVGYDTTTFNAITVGVQNDVVTLGGTVYGPQDKDSALSLVANTPGVKDIVDHIEVAPLSPMDDQLRLRLRAAIYGAQQLQKYALDPAKPIRITVINGNVTLSGVVDSKSDSDIANIRANGVPGVFKVINNLQVAGESSSSSSSR